MQYKSKEKIGLSGLRAKFYQINM